MSSSLGNAMLEQGSDYGLAGVEGMLYGETMAGAEELDPWTAFVQATFERHISDRRRRRR
jgi:hypothetical protein